MRKTRIVATLGPSSCDAPLLDALIAAGLDVARLNFSHGDHEFHRRNCALVRERAEVAGRPVAVLMDLQGPKIRVGKLPGGAVHLAPGETLVIDCATDALPGPGRVPCDHPGLAADVQPGDPVLLDDGKLRLEVTSISGTEVSCRVLTGGELKERKGINLPASHVSIPALTAKDRRDLLFGVQELGK